MTWTLVLVRVGRGKINVRSRPKSYLSGMECDGLVQVQLKSCVIASVQSVPRVALFLLRWWNGDEDFARSMEKLSSGMLQLFLFSVLVRTRRAWRRRRIKTRAEWSGGESREKAGAAAGGGDSRPGRWGHGRRGVCVRVFCFKEVRKGGRRKGIFQFLI